MAMRFIIMITLYGAALLGLAIYFAVMGIAKICRGKTRESSEVYSGKTKENSEAYSGKTKESSEVCSGKTRENSEVYSGKTRESSEVCGGKAEKNSGDRDIVNTIALVAGAVFVILAGCIFATTTWRRVGSFAKIGIVEVSAAASFLAGWAADKKLHIRKTAMVCHFLGSVFVFLLAVTAGYFRMLGPVFTFGEDGWWCVLGLGFMGFLGGLAAGVFRFKGAVYEKVLFLSFQAGTIFLGGCCMVVFWNELLDVGGLHLETVLFGIVCLLMTAAGNGWLALKKKQEWAMVMTALSAAGFVHYTAIFLPVSVENLFFFMAVLMTVCFLVLKTFCGIAAEIICSLALLADTGILAILELFGPGRFLDEIRLLAALFMLGFVLWVWGKRVPAIKPMIPFIMWYLVIPVRALVGEVTPWMPDLMWFTFLYVGGLAVWELLKREPWEPAILAIGGLSLYFEALAEASGWEATWAVLLGLYGCKKAFDGREKITWAIVAVLTLESLFAGGLANALILEGVCFILYFLAHKKENRRLAKGSGILMILIAIYVMKDFWMNLAWWVYLLCAGIGLMVFAAVREKKN